jgi:hypothetical protein
MLVEEEWYGKIYCLQFSSGEKPKKKEKKNRKLNGAGKTLFRENTHHFD